MHWRVRIRCCSLVSVPACIVATSDVLCSYKAPMEVKPMVQAGLREFKNRFGYYVRKVREGETVEVTDRGRSLGHFVPSGEAALRKKLEPLIKKGLVSWGGGPKPVGLDPPIQAGGKPASEIIVEDRE